MLVQKTRIVATHRVENWDFCDRLIALVNGEIVFDGTYEEFLKSEYYRRIDREEEKD